MKLHVSMQMLRGPSTMTEPLPITAVILTKNEARHLPGCLASVQGLVRHVLVVDSGSTDGTVQLAQSTGAEVVERPFSDFASQRNAALQLVRDPWVLFLDADERITPVLAREIRLALQHVRDEVAGFWLARQNFFFGRWVRAGGWWPDYQLRLFRVGQGRYRPDQLVHEVVELHGHAQTLHAPLLHVNYETVGEFVAKQFAYARLDAQARLQAGYRPRLRTYLGQPARAFWRRFVQLRGYRDGLLGLFLAGTLATAELVVWLLVRRGMHQHQRDESTVRVALAPLDPTISCSVVIVNYNVREHVLACLTSIAESCRSSGLNAEVIVVDNASSDGSVDAIQQQFPWARVIALPENRGYAAGVNAGIRAAHGAFIIVLNPDTRIVGDALAQLVATLRDHPDVGVVGPQLRYPDGRIQPSRRRFPTLLTALLESTVIQDYWRNNRVLRRYYMADFSDAEPHDVDWLVGACLGVRRQVIEQVGGMDERFFLYSEEVEWCWRIRRAGWRIVYEPRAVIVHVEGASAGQEPARRQIAFDTAKVQLYDILYGRPLAQFVRVFLLSNYLVRIAIEGGKWLLGHKRALRRQRVVRYWQAFRSGLRPASW